MSIETSNISPPERVVFEFLIAWQFHEWGENKIQQTHNETDSSASVNAFTTFSSLVQFDR